MLSIEGWLNGIITTSLILIAGSSGLYLIFKSMKLKTKPLIYLGFAILFSGLTYSYLSFDFLTILITGNNIIIPLRYILILIFYIILAIGIGFWLNISAELLFPNKKWYIILIFVIIEIPNYIITVLYPANNITFIEPNTPGEDIFDDVLTLGSPVFFVVLILAFYIMIINGFGLLYKSLTSKGLFRKKFLLLSFGFFMWVGFGIFDLTFYIPIPIFIIRIGVISSYIFMYLGLKQEKVKKQKRKIPTKAELALKSYLISKSPPTNSKKEVGLARLDITDKILIFLSYATKDAEMFRIQEISKKLTDCAQVEDVLYWQEDMDDNIFEYMDENLGKCDVMVLFCSENALKSVPVKKEWTAADALGKPIIPVFIDSSHIPPLLSSRLGFEYDFYDMERNIQELLNLILKKVGGLAE